MIALVKYSHICNKKPQEIVDFLKAQPKTQIRDVLIEDLLNINALQKPFADFDYREIFLRGIYLFYNESHKIRYVGSTNQGFLQRLMCHVDTNPKGFWGWNMILRKLGGERLNIAHDKLTSADHEYDWDVFQNYHLQLIDISHSEADAPKLKRIEKVIMKAYRSQFDQRLLNERIGWLAESEKKMKLEVLV